MQTSHAIVDELQPAQPAQPAQAPIRVPVRLDAAGSQLAAWIVVAVVNAVAIGLLLPMPSGGKAVRAAHHLYDAGQVLALGLLSSAVAELWGRSLPRRRVLGYGVLGAISVLLAAAVLAADLTGAAGQLSGTRSEKLWLALLIAAFGLTIPGAAIAGRLLARSWWRIAGILLGLAPMIANHMLLADDYPGVHLYMAWAGAMLLGASLQGLVVPRVVPLPRAAAWSLRGAAALVAAFSVVVPPSNATGIQILKLSGAPIAPFVARLHYHEPSDTGALAMAGPWFHERAAAPDVPPSRPPLLPPGGNVIFIIIDAVRADVLAEGKHSDLLPELDKLRRRSVEFTQAYSPATGTIWTLASLFSSRYYSQLDWTVKPDGVSKKVYPHEDGSIRFPEVLARGGITTIQYSEMPDLVNEYGIARGFTEARSLRSKKTPAAASVMSAAIDRLKTLHDRPFFFYLHFLEPHSPYDRGGRQGSPFDRYLREVAVVDREIGHLLQALDREGLASRTAVIVAADHGEAFGEHNTTHHGYTVYSELTRIPLLLYLPNLSARTVDRPVSLIDLGATVLDLMGQPTPGAFMGQSLLPVVRGESDDLDRPLVMDTGRWQRAMIFDGGFKVIEDRRKGTIELYDLRADPGELVNLANDPRSDGRHLAILHQFFRVHALQRPGYVAPYRP